MFNLYFLTYLAVLVAAFLLATALVPIVKQYAEARGIVDKPEAAARKVHQTPIPLLGGWAIFLATLIVIILLRYFQLADFSVIPLRLFVGFILASVVIMIGGYLDDRYNLKPYEQIIFPLSAVIIVMAAGLRIGFVTNPLGAAGSVVYVASGLSLVITFCWLMGMMYTTKFLDGLDGLVAGISVIAAWFIFLTSLRWEGSPLSVTGIWALALGGACLGFLIYNWQPAKIFLGEGGSIYIGFSLAVLSIITGSKIATTLLVMGIPALDVVWVVIRRLCRHKSPFSGDREHLHYRLLDLGLEKKQAVWLLYLLAIIFGSLGIVSTSYGKLMLVLGLVLVMGIFTVLLWKKRAV